MIDDNEHQQLDRAGFVQLHADVSGAKTCAAAMAQIALSLGRPGPTTTLHAREQVDAEAWSLSGAYGRGAFPWHNDGAVSSGPPRWLVLRHLYGDTDVPTELLRPDEQTLNALRATLLQVTSRYGQRTYSLAALNDDVCGYRLRWDPRVCKTRAGLTPAEMDRNTPTAELRWESGRVAVIDNFRMLHRRPLVPAKTERILERIHVWSS